MSTKGVKKFIEKNKETINNKIICQICGGSYSYFNKAHHLKTKKHKDNINKKINNETLEKLMIERLDILNEYKNSNILNKDLMDMMYKKHDMLEKLLKERQDVIDEYKKMLNI